MLGTNGATAPLIIDSEQETPMKSPSRKFFGAAGGVVLFCLGGLLSSPARVVTVSVSNSANNFAFFPAVTNITTGDQVIWVWNSVGSLFTHSATDTNVWDSGLHPSPFSFTNTFNTTGTFQYVCSHHSSLGMTGAVVVATLALPPTIAITNPASGTVFASPASVTIQVAVTNGSSSVTNLQFLVGSNVLTNETTAPFSAATNNLGAGSYTLAAIASDSNGLFATNKVNISIVTPVTVVLTNSAKLSATNFQFSYPANVGLRYVIQVSTNLAPPNWISIVTNVAASNPVAFLDNHATNKSGFYRVGRMPNP